MYIRKEQANLHVVVFALGWYRLLYTLHTEITFQTFTHVNPLCSQEEEAAERKRQRDLHRLEKAKKRKFTEEVTEGHPDGETLSEPKRAKTTDAREDIVEELSKELSKGDKDAETVSEPKISTATEPT